VFSLVNLAVNMTLPAFAAERRAAAPLLLGDIFCPHGAQQQTRRTPLLRPNDGTDGRTPDRYRPCFAYYAGNAKNTEFIIL